MREGPTGECSKQMYKLYQLLMTKGITLYNSISKGWHFFECKGIRYYIQDGNDGLRMTWTKKYDRKVTPRIAVEIATSSAVLDYSSELGVEVDDG